MKLAVGVDHPTDFRTEAGHPLQSSDKRDLQQQLHSLSLARCRGKVQRRAEAVVDVAESMAAGALGRRYALRLRRPKGRRHSKEKKNSTKSNPHKTRTKQRRRRN